jgi:hypothetical protein
MTKIPYTNLKLKVNNEVNTFEYNEHKIEVLKYLDVDSKYDLVMITLQKSEENGIYNQLKLDMYFNLYIVYMYTNISFTEKQKENESKLYDTLKSNGIIDKVLENMEESEYNDLYGYINSIIEDTMKYRNTAGAVLQSVIQDLPKNAAAAAEIVNNFDASKYQAVVDFATAANGGRDINTNNVVQMPIVTE